MPKSQCRNWSSFTPPKSQGMVALRDTKVAGPSPVRLLCEDAARLCWLPLERGAAAESDAGWASLLAFGLSLLLAEIQRLRMAASSSLSPLAAEGSSLLLSEGLAFPFALAFSACSLAAFACTHKQPHQSILLAPARPVISADSTKLDI